MQARQETGLAAMPPMMLTWPGLLGGAALCPASTLLLAVGRSCNRITARRHARCSKEDQSSAVASWGVRHDFTSMRMQRRCRACPTPCCHRAGCSAGRCADGVCCYRGCRPHRWRAAGHTAGNSGARPALQVLCVGKHDVPAGRDAFTN